MAGLLLQLGAEGPRRDGVRALVLAPTRELAMQVLGTCRALRRPCGVRSEAIYGGEPREDQIEAMEASGLHLLVATTGRLVDMVLSRDVRLDHATLLVLDEADRLLATGNLETILKLHAKLPPRGRTGGGARCAWLMQAWTLVGQCVRYAVIATNLNR